MPVPVLVPILDNNKVEPQQEEPQANVILVDVSLDVVTFFINFLSSHFNRKVFLNNSRNMNIDGHEFPHRKGEVPPYIKQIYMNVNC